MDFFTVPAFRFQVLHVLFIIHHTRRKIIHLGTTPNLTTARVGQRLREALPDDEAPRYPIFDRDGNFGQDVIKTLRGMGVKTVRTAFRSP